MWSSGDIKRAALNGWRRSCLGRHACLLAEPGRRAGGEFGRRGCEDLDVVIVDVEVDLDGVRAVARHRG